MSELNTAATACAAAQNFLHLINQAILYPLIALLVGVAMLVFLYGGLKYVTEADNPTVRENGRKHMLWGIIGLLVMTSAYAILEIAAGSFGASVPLCN